ncbi:amidohydrolase [Staphylococcus simiae]|uniref:amidohydrolase family protein n=1 Tax=Staphylococcus simiae TaxID=308354 RepID=UPI001A963270|nr:amidohydrolase family protein [Staphylococcus simiae]MBO1198232.1 amidohydrolase [Staphylococcus simiae]MBO1200933.1 amidohydrolase [Staphylococcus simiae]MBO1203106.1 amidohydrolase [Staphylococcus simiae]MBO1210224.1 amidohydrolase [Staphylococcus simiae]MBO1229271.1 amidohydrolase [Staphylococcus simiae]
MAKIIDTHAHLWNEDYLDKLGKLGSKGTEVAKGINQSGSKEDLNKRFKDMDDSGVDMQILSATPQSPQWGTKEEAHQCANEINDLYRSLVQQYPDRFLAYGAVSLPYVDQAIEEAKTLLQQEEFVGIAIPTIVKDKVSIADKQFEPFFEAINDLHGTLYIHPTGCGAQSPLVNDYTLEWVIGAPLESTFITLHLLKNNIPQQYPNIKFHISHLGGALPFFMTRIEDNYEDWNAFDSDPWEILNKQFVYDTANFHEPSLINSVETFGADKFMMGSDFPYFQDEKYKRSVDYIKNSRLDQADIDGILSGNAIKFFNINHKH